MGITLLTS